MNNFLKLLGFSVICSALTLSGCGLREAKKQQKIREAEAAAKRSAELNHELSEDFMNEAARQARKDLEDRIRYVRGIEGEFQGSYSTTQAAGNTTQAGKVVVTISAQNIPAPFIDYRPITAAQLQSEMENISLVVEILEESLVNSDVKMFCSVSGIKPDYERGLVRISCQNVLNSPTRDYLFSLDDAELDVSMSISEDTVSSRGMITSLALIEGRKSQVSELNLRIASPFGKLFRLRMQRQGAPDQPAEEN